MLGRQGRERAAILLEDGLNGCDGQPFHNGRYNEGAMRLEFAFQVASSSLPRARYLKQLCYVKARPPKQPVASRKPNRTTII